MIKTRSTSNYALTRWFGIRILDIRLSFILRHSPHPLFNYLSSV